MPIFSGVSPTQDFHTPGALILTWTSSDTLTVPSVTVQINPALVRLVQPQFAPIQRINVADNGKVHVFQLSSNEELHLPIEIHNLHFDDFTPAGAGLNGFNTLRNFIRSTLNY